MSRSKELEWEESACMLVGMLAEAHGNMEMLLRVLESSEVRGRLPKMCRLAIQVARDELNEQHGKFMAYFGDEIGGANPGAN